MKIGERVPFSKNKNSHHNGVFDGFSFGRVVSFDEDTVCVLYMQGELIFVSRAEVDEFIKECSKG